MQKCRGFLISALFQAEFIEVRFHQHLKAALKEKETLNSGCSLPVSAHTSLLWLLFGPRQALVLVGWTDPAGK